MSPVMPRFALLIYLLAASMAVERAAAQVPDRPAEITVLSVLTMAKEAAESTKGEWRRAQLKYRVAQSIEATGQVQAFGSYVDDAANRWEMLNQPPAGVDQIILDTIARNREVRAEVKRHLLAGNSELAETVLRRCQRVHNWDMTCEDRDPFVALRLIAWEAVAGRLDAAMHRLHSSDWRDEDWRAIAAMHVARALIATGRRSEGLDVLRIAHPPDHPFDASIVWRMSSGSGADFRKLACEGQVNAALAAALRIDDVARRTIFWRSWPKG
jgi:hypothetical protein